MAHYERRAETESTTRTNGTTSNRLRLSAICGLVGGLWWAAWPLGDPVLFPGEGMALLERVYGALSIVPAALLIVGLVGLHTLHGKQYGRLGTGGFVASVGALGLMGVGMAMDALTIETSFSAVSDIGHLGFFLGFAVLIVGSLALGFAIQRAKVLPWARFTGPALAVAIPAGIVAVIVKETYVPSPVSSDLWFFIAFMTAYGSVWVALGSDVYTAARSTADTVEPTPA